MISIWRWLRLRFDFDSTAVRLLIKDHSDVTLAADLLGSHADLFIYLDLSAAAHIGRHNVGYRAIVALSNCSRTGVE